MIGNSEPLARALRLPYFPLTPLFPWLGPIGAVPLPSNWIIEFCRPGADLRPRGRRRADQTTSWWPNWPTRSGTPSRPSSTSLLVERGPAFGS